MSETVPIVIGIAVSLFIVHYILNSNPRRNHQAQAHPHNNPNNNNINGTPVNPAIVTRESEEQLRVMFPNVPASVVRMELLRATSMQSAIERLLALSSSYPLQSPVPTTTSTRVESDSDKKSSVSSIKSLDGSRVESVDQETWTKDSTVRERLLKQKKAVMLQEARKKFMDKQQQQQQPKPSNVNEPSTLSLDTPKCD